VNKVVSKIGEDGKHVSAFLKRTKARYGLVRNTCVQWFLVWCTVSWTQVAMANDRQDWPAVA